MTKALKYCARSLGVTLRDWDILGAITLFFAEAFSAGAIALGLVYLVLLNFNLNFWGKFLVGLILGALLMALYLLAALLKARVILRYPAMNLPAAQRLSKVEVLRHALAAPWLPRHAPLPDPLQTEKPAASERWQKGAHLVLPTLVARDLPLEAAELEVESRMAGNPPAFNPARVAVAPLTLTLLALLGVAGLLLALGFISWFTTGLVTPLPVQIRAAALGLLAFMVLFTPEVAFSAVMNGYYQADLFLRASGGGLDGTEILSKVIKQDAYDGTK